MQIARWEGGRITGDSLKVQVHEWHGWISLWPHQSRASSVSVVVPSKSSVLRGSENTVCGLCALISGSHGKGYYTTAASVFALAPGARHDPRTDVLCRPRWSLEVTKYHIFCNEWKIACLFLSQRLSFLMNELISLSDFSQRRVVFGGWWFCASGPARTRHSLSVKEPVSRLPLIYGDANAKLSHMALQLSWTLCWGYREEERKGRRLC